MINWFNMPAEGLSNGGLFEIKELAATENKVYQKDGEVYNKVTVNVPSPTGKITITENGTDIDVAQYATADVAVEGGSSDFSTAEVTLVNSGESGLAVIIPVLYEAEPPFNPNAQVIGFANIMANETIVLNVPLYKGHCVIVKGASGDRMQGDTVATSFTVTSGSATSSLDGVDITGDCTITIS